MSEASNGKNDGSNLNKLQIGYQLYHKYYGAYITVD